MTSKCQANRDQGSGPQKAHAWLKVVAGMQFLAALWATLNALVASEMSVLLAAGAGAYALTVGMAGVFLVKHRRWAWRVSALLALGVALLGLVLVVMIDDAPVLGIAHVAAGALLLCALWGGRAAVRSSECG